MLRGPRKTQKRHVGAHLEGREQRLRVRANIYRKKTAMSKTSTQVGRAAFNLKHLRRDNCGGDTTRGDRKRLLKEAMRELDPQDLAHQAAMNSNIVVADAHLNVPFVNNGDGTFRRATSVEEVLRLPSSSGHPICADLVSVGEDVHCESTAQEIHALSLIHI